jgi:hypothetical protein
MNGKDVKAALNGSLNDFEDRHYLGMSAISKCPRSLYNDLVNGRPQSSLKSARYYHEGYLHEHDIVARLIESGLAVMNCQRELIAPWDERLRFRGHIDGELDGVLLEIKSVNDERFVSVMNDGPFDEHCDQCQMYMRYGGYARAIIVYKCRNDGDLWIEEVARDDQRGLFLEEKARGILVMVDRREPPRCTCGHCRE